MKLNIRRTRAFVAGLGIVAGTAVGLLGPGATAHAEETPTRKTTVTLVDRARSGYDYGCDSVTIYGVLSPDRQGENAVVCKFTKWFIERDTPVDAETAAMMDAAIRQARGLPLGTEYSKRYYSMPQGPGHVQHQLRPGPLRGPRRRPLRRRSDGRCVHGSGVLPGAPEREVRMTA